MPNSEKIELLISPEALKQFEQLKSSTDANTASFEKLIAKAVELNKAMGNAATFKEINKATKEMTDNEKALAKQVDELSKANAKLQALYTEEAKKIAEVKAQQQARNVAIKEEIQLNQAAEGSIKQKQIQIKQLQRDYDNLSSAEREASKGQDLLKSIQVLDKELKQLEGTTGRFQRNVGNYANSFSDAFGTVNGSLQKIQQQIKSGNNGGQQLQSLQRQEQILTSITEQLGQEFSSTRQQSRAFQEAVAKIGIEFGHQSAVFQAFKDQVGEGVDSLNDIRDSIKLAASDTRQLDRLIGAATALAGGFSIAQGAAGLFGKENEDLQKSLVKIQSVMAILNGLQSIQNELKNKDSILRKLTSFLIKEETKAAQAQAVANTATATATDTATKATNRFGVALKSIGIGIILTLIPLVSSAMSNLGSTTNKVDKDLEGMGETALDIADSAINELKEEINSLNEELGQTPSAIEKAVKAAVLLGQEMGKVAAQTSTQDIRGFVAEIQNLWERSEFRVTTIQRQFSELSQKIKELEYLNKLKTAEQYLNDLFDKNQEAIKNEADLDKDANDRKLARLKKLFDERELSERKFNDQSKASLRSSLSDELNIIQANLNQQLSQAGANIAKREQAENTAAKERILAYRNYSDKVKEIDETILKRRIEDEQRKRKALLSILKTELDDSIKSNELIANDEAKSFDKRTSALYAAYEDRRELIFAQYEDELKNTKLSAEERIAIEKKYISDINGLTIEYGLQQQAIYKDNTDKVNEIIEKGQQGRLDKISAQQSLELIALTESFRRGNISAEDYARERANIEQRYRIISLKEEVNNATAKVLATKEGTAERYAAEKELADKTLALNDEVTAKQIDAQRKLADLKKQLASEISETFNAIINADFDNESARIQNQIDELDRQKEKEIEVANASIANKEQRELAIAKIEAQAQAEREQLERRQRKIELERARFEKASNIAQIIGSTAVAIVKQLAATPLPAGAPLVAAIAAIGALQLARAIATPLPKFAEGTDDAPGGLSWVGDGGKKELVITPSGQVMQTPAVPTVMNVPKHSIVLPDARAALESGLAVNRHGRLVQQSNGDIKEVGRKIDTLTKVMRNKPVLNMSTDQGGLTAMWKYGANKIKYIEDQTGF